jgi:hypothetical protein
MKIPHHLDMLLFHFVPFHSITFRYLPPPPILSRLLWLLLWLLLLPYVLTTWIGTIPKSKLMRFRKEIFDHTM